MTPASGDPRTEESHGASLVFWGHPFSSYCQKVLVALYENATPFQYRRLDFGDPDAVAALGEIWPLQRMPILVEHGRTIVESSSEIEYLQLEHPGRTRFLPDDPRAALEVRTLDRIFDNYVQTPMQKIVLDAIRAPEQRDPAGVADARRMLDTAYRWLDGTLRGREWAAGGEFTLADCAAAPALFYADWVHPIAAELGTLRAYRARLLARPSFSRAVNEARPYRAMFPPGAPERD